MITPKEAHEILAKNTNKDVFDMTLDLEKSKGSFIYDSLHNRTLLDCFSFIASNPIGHNHPKMDDPAFEKKLLRVAKTNPSNSDILCVEFAEFVKTFVEVAVPKELPNLFFVAGGALAVENAIKAAFDWKVKKNLLKDVIVDPNALEVIHFKQAFHGRSGYTLSLTNTDPAKYRLFPKFKWPRFEPAIDPAVHREGKFPLMPEVALGDIEEYLDRNSDKVAAIIIEPIQGEGGDRHFHLDFHRGLRRLADKFEVIFIYDEVQTGLGLTGKMWAYQNYGVTPDIVSFGKKMQVCGIMASNRLHEIPNNVFVEKSRLNSTWGGNLVDMVRCQRYLEIIKEDNLVENAAQVGELIRIELKGLQSKCGLITNVRGQGLMIAFDLNTTELRNKFVKKVLDNGVLLLGCGDRSVRLRPSLTFSRQDTRVLISALSNVINEMEKE